MSADRDPAASLFDDGTRLLRQGRAAEAETALRQAIELRPDLAEAHANLGLVLDGAGRRAEAEACYRRSLALAPGVMQTHLNLGALLMEQKRLPEAEAAFRQALAIDPAAPGTWSNLGVCLACRKREAEAETCYRTALELDPAHRGAAFNLAYILLRQGRYAEGWQRFEARARHDFQAHFGRPPWQGESLAGKGILIAFEGGQGDMIQFCRYAPLLKARGARRVAVLCHPGLKTLLAGMDDIDRAIGFDEAFEEDCDGWVYPMSLPGLFQTRLENIPASLPYLHIDAERMARWRAMIDPSGGMLRVGLAWKGNPRFENDPDRSLPSLDVLAPLGEVPGVRYFSLQKGAGEAEAAHPPDILPLADLGPRLGDFAETGAAIMNLDLVIAVDTAVAHLAGALGKPCWLLLPDYKPDWRWLADREDSPWYPGVMRLFRQEAEGDWAGVVARVEAALRALAASGEAGRARA